MKADPQVVMVVDCDCFFVSCERLFRPDLAGRPVVVLSSNDGCVISRSKEAKAAGIAMGEPLFRARALIKRHGVRVFSSNFNLYRQLSTKVSQALSGLVPPGSAVRQYSIDEWFITTKSQSAAETAALIARELPASVGVPVTIGTARTATLAKLALRQAKSANLRQFELDPEKEAALLEKAPVGEVWGIGRRLSPRLQRAGLRTARQLAGLTPPAIRQLGLNNLVFLKTVQELNGKRCIINNENNINQHSLTLTRTFGHKVVQRNEIEAIIAEFTTSLCKKLRGKDLLATGLTVFLSYRLTAQKPGSGRYLKNQSGKTLLRIFFEQPTCDQLLILAAITERFDELYRPNTQYGRAGITVTGLEPRTYQSISLDPQLFSGQPYRQSLRREKLLPSLDRLNDGGAKVRLASELLGSGRWRPKNAFNSGIDLKDPARLPMVA